MYLIYYWRDFADNTRRGRIHKLNQRNSLLAELGAGGIVWTLARTSSSLYVLAARFVVEHSGRNSPSDPDYERYGEYYFQANPTLTRYFRVDRQPSIEPLIRSLSIKTDAEHLGQSFQGKAGVRQLTEADHEILERYAASLP
jgi:hypothetical protein